MESSFKFCVLKDYAIPLSLLCRRKSLGDHGQRLCISRGKIWLECLNYAIHNDFFLILGLLYQIEHKQRGRKIKMSISPVKKKCTGRIAMGLIQLLYEHKSHSYLFQKQDWKCSCSLGDVGYHLIIKSLSKEERCF